MSLKQVALVKGVCGIDWCSWVIGAFDTFGRCSYCHCCSFPWCRDVWLRLVRARGVFVPLLVVAKAMKVVLIFASRSKVGVTKLLLLVLV